MNQLTLIGNLTRDPETRTAQSGTVVCNFSIAWNDPFDKDKKATFFKATAFGKTAEVCEKYLRKGQPVCIVGKVGLDKWTNKDGVEMADLAVIVEKVHLLGGKRDDAPDREQRQPEPSRERQPSPAARPQASDQSEDDLPF